MKRPIALYFVAAWCFVVSYAESYATERLLLHWFTHVDQFGNRLLTIIQHVAALVMSTWLVFGLLQLRKVRRWICVVMLAIAAGLAGMFVVGNMLVIAEYADPLAFLIAFHIAIVTGGVSIYSLGYLSRRSFREFARQFVEERQKQKAGAAGA